MSLLALRFLVIVLFISLVQCRILRLNSDDEEYLISGGINDVDQSQLVTSNVTNKCDHQYGFLPCAENAGGYIFQILVYQGLLMYGEKELSAGSRVLFNILGANQIVGIIFRILVGLPALLIMIVSGVFSSKEDAQSKVALGVGIYAGITVFTLTVQWGACVILGRRSLLDQSTPTNSTDRSLAKEVVNDLKDTGVKLDDDTRKLARIMLVSLIPYVIIQLVNIFKTSSGNRVGILISLVISTISLISYFVYQVMNPWMQQKSLDYSKYETLKTGFLRHMQQHGKLINEHGDLNLPVIRKIFREADKDGNENISKAEMEKLVQSLFNKGEMAADKQLALSEAMKLFDANNNGSVNSQEFVNVCTKFINEANDQIRDSSATIPKKEDDPKEIDSIRSKVLAHARTQLLKSKSLITDDGNPNVDGIKNLFKEFDKDRNNEISKAELEQIILTLNFEGYQPNYKEIVDEIFKDFDEDGNGSINERELAKGLMRKTGSNEKESVNIHQIVKQKVLHGESLVWTCIKSVLQIVLGIVMMTCLGGPLTTSILQLSYSISAPSFAISFIVVPLAMNARAAIAAISPASHKTDKTDSLTFSEIYGGVVMSNISNLTALLAIVYAKDLEWDYSAEVLTVLVVCAIIGFLAFKRTNYPLWTCLLAFFLYPFSLGLFYYAQYVLKWN